MRWRQSRERTYPNDPRDTAQGCLALIAVVAVPGLFAWGFANWDGDTWWKFGVAIALFLLFLRSRRAC